jgi:hypothetical protein
MRRLPSAARRRRGRPQKFGRPGELVQLTLPTDVIRGLRRMDDDLARAVVRLVELAPAWALGSSLDVELLSIADRRFLIVINRSVIKTLPGVDIIPIEGQRAFLALTPGRGVSDLELAVIDRLSDAADLVDLRERQALEHLREQLRVWRDDPALQFRDRAIIVVESTPASRQAKASRAPMAVQPDVERVAFTEGRSLIVVNTTVIRTLPGVDIIPIGRARGFLALAPGRAATDLELAVDERLAATADARERQALGQLRRELKARRPGASHPFQPRSIIIVEAPAATGSDGTRAALRAGTFKRPPRTPRVAGASCRHVRALAARGAPLEPRQAASSGVGVKPARF